MKVDFSAWVGRQPTDKLNGIDFFLAMGTQLGAVYYHERLQSDGSARKIRWGRIIADRFPQYPTDRPMMARLGRIFVVPMCFEGECEDPDRGATRLVALYEVASNSNPPYWNVFHAKPYAKGILACDSTTSLSGDYQSEETMPTCAVLPTKPNVISPSNIGAEFKKLMLQYGNRRAEVFQKNLPQMECLPKVVGQDNFNIGAVVFPCLSAF